MSRENFGWSLPPGVTSKMIEDAQGGDHGYVRVECVDDPDTDREGCGWDAEVWSEDLPEMCPKCGGKLEVKPVDDSPDPDEWHDDPERQR